MNQIIEKLGNSRDMVISFILHVILIAVFGGTILFKAVQEPPDFTTETQLVNPSANIPKPVQNQPAIPQMPSNVGIQTQQTQPITTTSIITPQAVPFTITHVQPPPNLEAKNFTPAAQTAEVTKPILEGIKGFRETWVTKRDNVGTRPVEYEFTAYIGQYSGNWNSTIQSKNNTIENGSLPNLLYFMSETSKNKVKTNYKNVKAIKLDSDEIFATKPPFIFLTGTRDFTLSDKEVENLRTYIRLGGAIWGDSSVPGKNSRFDIAFKREMKRVIPDIDKKWETVQKNHPLYTSGYFPEVRDDASGVNSYKEPIQVLRQYGEIAIIYTSNDYGDMWQVGLAKNQIDMRKSVTGEYVALNPTIWNNRDTYLRNINLPALIESYKFGTNIVIHLLNRWEDKKISKL